MHVADLTLVALLLNSGAIYLFFFAFQEVFMDPCLENDCNPLARCIPNDSVYDCECIDGYEGDGYTCVCKYTESAGLADLLNGWLNPTSPPPLSPLAIMATTVSVNKLF